MDIKEIAEQVSKRIYVEDGLLLSKFISEKFAAAIESYKAELLKEVGEPFGFYYEINGTWDAFVVGKTEPDDDVYDEGSLKALFTSDQVAAAILKATKPLEEEIERLNQQSANRLIGLCKCGEDNDELRAQLAAAQEANEHWQRATAENENKWIEANDKLAKAEQRVAEACALQVATETRFHWLDAARVAKEIRSGEWRKFVKEV